MLVYNYLHFRKIGVYYITSVCLNLYKIHYVDPF